MQHRTVVSIPTRPPFGSRPSNRAVRLHLFVVQFATCTVRGSDTVLMVHWRDGREVWLVLLLLVLVVYFVAAAWLRYEMCVARGLDLTRELNGNFPGTF